MTTHALKTWPEFFHALMTGQKTFEIRQNDRSGGFQVGDILLLQEWSPAGGYSGRMLQKEITYLLSGMGLKEGYICMAVADPPPHY